MRSDNCWRSDAGRCGPAQYPVTLRLVARPDAHPRPTGGKLGPANAASVPRIDRALVTAKGLRVVLDNDGNRHVAPSKIAVSGLDAAGTSVWNGNADEWYVLSKSERSADLELPAATCAKIKNFAVTWTMGANAITKSLPNGGCH